jgi:hypothetical protein
VGQIEILHMSNFKDVQLANEAYKCNYAPTALFIGGTNGIVSTIAVLA